MPDKRSAKPINIFCEALEKEKLNPIMKYEEEGLFLSRERHYDYRYSNE